MLDYRDVGLRINWSFEGHDSLTKVLVALEDVVLDVFCIKHFVVNSESKVCGNQTSPLVFLNPARQMAVNVTYKSYGLLASELVSPLRHYIVSPKFRIRYARESNAFIDLATNFSVSFPSSFSLRLRRIHHNSRTWQQRPLALF